MESKFSFASGNNRPLTCEFKPEGPVLNFSLRFEIGYVIRFPFEEFHGAGHGLEVFLRVTPQSDPGKPAYFANRYDLPPVPDTTKRGEVAGRLVLPMGRYRLESLVQDDTGRICRDDWSVEIKPSPAHVPRQVPARLGRLTVFLHAAPQHWNSPKLQALDVLILTSSLESLLDQLPARSVRLVVFNLDFEAELFRSDAFDPKDIEKVARILNRAQLATVNYQSLQRQRPPEEYLAGLINRELREPARSEAVVFLGPLARARQAVPKPAIDDVANGPKFFYLQFRGQPDWGPVGVPASPMSFERSRESYGAGLPAPPMPAPPAQIADAISRAMERLKGRTMIALAPSDFAHYLHQIATSRY